MYDRNGFVKHNASTLRLAIAKAGVLATVQLGFRGDAILHKYLCEDGKPVPVIVLLDAFDAR